MADPNIKKFMSTGITVLETVKGQIPKENRDLKHFENFITILFVSSEKDKDKLTEQFVEHENDNE